MYFSTEKQFEELMKVLEARGDRWEQQLIATLHERKEEIRQHMRMTKLLTSERKGERVSFLSLLDGTLAFFMMSLCILPSVIAC